MPYISELQIDSIMGYIKSQGSRALIKDVSKIITEGKPIDIINEMLQLDLIDVDMGAGYISIPYNPRNAKRVKACVGECMFWSKNKQDELFKAAGYEDFDVDVYHSISRHLPLCSTVARLDNMIMPMFTDRKIITDNLYGEWEIMIRTRYGRNFLVAHNILGIAYNHQQKLSDNAKNKNNIYLIA